MDVPSLLIRGDQRKESVFLKVNELIQYLRAERLYDDGRTVKVTRTAAGVLISATQPSGARYSASDYDGFLRVDLVEDGTTVTLSVVNGFDPESPVAGYAYYNSKIVPCAKKENIPIADGYLCLSISRDEDTYTVDYTIEDAIPDMPVLESEEDDNTAKYPLAQIIGPSEFGGWYGQRIHLGGVPALTCFGPCDPATT